MNGFPGSRLRARLRPDAPVVRGLTSGGWHDVFGGEAARLPPDGLLLLRPADVPIDDKAGYVEVLRGMVELGSTDGARLLLEGADRRCLAALVTDSAHGNGSAGDRRHTIRFVCHGGGYLLVPGVAAASLDAWSDTDLLALLEANRAEGQARTGLRTEARVKPAFAWGYRMLDPAAWYLVEPRWTTERALVLVTVDGDRVVDAAHFESRSFLD